LSTADFLNESALSSVRNPDPYVFGPPGSGSVSRRYKSGFGSGYGSFNHQAKIVTKTFIHPVLGLLYDFLSMKNDVNVASKNNFKNFF
jgi:hypothetical protein